MDFLFILSLLSKFKCNSVNVMCVTASLCWNVALDITCTLFFLFFFVFVSGKRQKLIEFYKMIAYSCVAPPHILHILPYVVWKKSHWRRLFKAIETKWKTENELDEKKNACVVNDSLAAAAEKICFCILKNIIIYLHQFSFSLSLNELLNCFHSIHIEWANGFLIFILIFFFLLFQSIDKIFVCR